MGSEERAPSLPTVEECLQAQSGGSLWPETPAPGDNAKGYGAQHSGTHDLGQVGGESMFVFLFL